MGEEAGAALAAELASGAPLDRWMGDQLVLYLGLLGGTMRASELSLHARTSLQVVERFLPVRFEVEDATLRTRPV